MGYTVEEIFKIYRFGNKEVLTLSFDINSNSYLRYGKEITLFIEFSDNELAKLISNIRENKVNHNFILKGKIIDNMDFIEIDLNDVIKINRF
jgi:hypothetical protein